MEKRAAPFANCENSVNAIMTCAAAKAGARGWGEAVMQQNATRHTKMTG